MKRLLLLLALTYCALCSPAQSAMTDWTEVQGGAVRLISAGPIENGRYLAGLEFLLEPGWHTYWRAPGEAGIPPEISLKASENLKSYEVLYPAPERYSDGFSESAVYHNGIVLPILVTPVDAAEDVYLKLELFFGVCREICVPGDATLELDLAVSAPTDSLGAKLIARDLAAIPGPDGPIAIHSVKLSESKDSLVIDAHTDGLEKPDLFAAGPEGSYMGLPKLASQSSKGATWILSTNGLTATEADRTLRLVLVAGGHAIEHLQPIDPDWLP